MRFVIALSAVLLAAFAAGAAEPVYIDQLMETPVATLASQFGVIKREGCFEIPGNRYLLISIDKKDQKPWRIVLTSTMPCRRPIAVGIDVAERNGVALGDNTIAVVERLGRPDASAPPEPALKKLGETEYFYICRVSAGCARHTSVLIRDGIVTAIAEWYSE